MTEPVRRPPAPPDLDKLAAFRAKIDHHDERGIDPAVREKLEREYAQRRQVAADRLGTDEQGIEAEVARRLGRPVDGADELVPADDAVIGRAFRGSLVVLALVGLVAAGAFWLLRPRVAERPEQAIDTAAPVLPETAATPPPLPFTDVTAAAGIDFVHFNGAYGDKLLPETMGGGVAFFDADADHDPDLVFIDSSPWPGRSAPAGARPRLRLYLNDGAGRFTDATDRSGLGVTLYGQGVAVGDFDNDGATDLYVTAVGENRLFRNLGGGRFADVTAAAGVAGADDAWSTAATFADFDNDGDLDLFVADYVRWSKEIDFQVDYRLVGVGRAYGPPMNYEGTYPHLYLNRGDGTFEDVSGAWGVEVDNPVTGRPAGKGLGVAPVDVDLDGWVDLLVANDTVGNFFFHNQGGRSFAERGAAYGLAYGPEGNATGAMGIDAGEYRNDSELAFVIGNFANEMTSLYLSQGVSDLFTDEAIGEGIGAASRTALTFGVLLVDVDLDGRLDVVQTNGHLEEEIDKVDPSQSYRQAAQLFWNAGPGGRQTFVQAPPESIGDLARPIVGRGSAAADLEGDGDLDLVLTQTGGPPLVLRNDTALGHHWLRLELVGDPAAGVNRNALGARVELTAGGVTQRRQLVATRSYLSQSEPVLTFGLGDADRVDRLTVTWPGGATQEVAVPAVDRLLVVEQAAAGG